MAEALPPRGAGLGLRRALLDELIGAPAGAFDFLECAPDNWIGVGGALGEQLETLSARHPLSCHGLSLSLGGPDPLDHAFLRQTRDFLDRHHAALYSEHLSYCAAGGHLYDLLPLPFTDEAVMHVAARIRQVQDALGRRIAVENVSYYAAPFRRLAETAFIQAVLAESERMVQTALEDLMRQRTTLVIAHRLATVQRADRIVVLDGGRVVQQGRHADLIAAGGLYARLARLQFAA